MKVLHILSIIPGNIFSLCSLFVFLCSFLCVLTFYSNFVFSLFLLILCSHFFFPFCVLILSSCVFTFLFLFDDHFCDLTNNMLAILILLLTLPVFTCFVSIVALTIVGVMYHVSQPKSVYFPPLAQREN